MNKELKKLFTKNNDIVTDYMMYKSAFIKKESTFLPYEEKETSKYPEDIKDIVNQLNKKKTNEDYILLVNYLIKHFEKQWLVDQFDDSIPEFTYNM